MLINLSNHPSAQWSEKQLEVAKLQYGEIIDMQFPNINPEADENQIEHLVFDYLQKIKDIANDKKCVVHPMGEMSFTFALISLLMKNKIECVASTSHRHSIIMDNNTKKIVFDFVKFRKYKLL